VCVCVCALGSDAVFRRTVNAINKQNTSENLHVQILTTHDVRCDSFFPRAHLQHERSAEVEQVDVARRVVIAAEVKVFVRKQHGVLGTRMVCKQIPLDWLHSYRTSHMHDGHFTTAPLFIVHQSSVAAVHL